jgi:hypothetical protein
MSVTIGSTKIAYQKTKVFDTAGAHTFIHPLPGKNIEVFVELIGAAGGGFSTGGSQKDGGDSIWDTAGSNNTASGGTGASANNAPGVGFINGLYNTDVRDAVVNHTIANGLYGNAGFGITGGAFATGGSGYVKRFNATISGDINITVGAGGGLDEGSAAVNAGQDGACIVHYNVIESETPVQVSATPQVDEYAEVAWRSAPDEADLPIGTNTFTDVTLNTEVIDTGNNVVVNGDDTFTLQAGTYEVNLAEFYINNGNDYIINLYNITDASVDLIFKEVYGGSKSESNSVGFIKIASPKIFKLRAMNSTGTGSIGTISTDFTNSDAGVDSRVRLLLTRKAYS